MPKVFPPLPIASTKDIYIERPEVLDKYLELCRQNDQDKVAEYVESLEEWEQAVLMADCIAHKFLSGGGVLII
jgi:hypothetical protein